MLTTLDHVILAVRDLEAARHDYRQLLGLEPSWSGAHPDAGTANVLFRLENTYLELLAPAGEGPLGNLLQGWLSDRGDGLLGVVLGTDDIDACRRTLHARGLAPGPVERGEGHDETTGAVRRWRRVALPVDRTRGVLLFPIQHDSPNETLPMARATGAADAVAFAVDHVVVQATDAEAARTLYGDALGIRLALDKEFTDWGVRLMFFRIGGVTLEVAAALGAAAQSVLLDSGPTTNEDRLYGMTYRVRNAEASRARLTDAGFDVSEVRTGRRPGTRVFTVRNRTCEVPTLMLEPPPRQE